MGIEEKKVEVINEISKIENEGKIQEILAFVKTISTQKLTSLNLSQHYDKVNKQYTAVLKKLAQ